jgi:6-phosphogluconolactonase (cycloisomerase 2 family)
VFAVNPGDNTVSMFTVNKNDSTQLTMVGSPANTMGEFPVAVAFSKKHHTACVVNSGGDSNLACFSVSKNGLTPLNNTVRSLGVNQTNPPTGPANTVSDILFNQDESALLVSVKGTPNGTVGFIANYGISRNHSFTLDADPVISTPDKGLLPFSMTLVGECGDVLFNTDAAFGVSVSQFDPSTGDIIASSSVAIDNQTATCWSSTSPRTGSFYVTDVGNAIVSEFSVDPTGPSAKLLARHTLDGIGGRIDQAVASTHAGDFLYALGAKARSVNVLKLTGPGKARQIQTFVVTDAVPDLPISVQGMAVFVK